MSDFYVNNEFFDAVQNDDTKILAEGVEEINQKLFDAWHNSPHGTLPDLIRKCVQRSRFARTILGNWRNTTAYYVGMLYGIVQVYSELSQEEKEQETLDEQIKKIIPRPGAVTKKIFDKLIDIDRYNGWISHGKLAKDLETSKSSLSNIMKRLVASGAVESEKNGRFTNYRITSMGKRYYERFLFTAQENNEIQILDESTKTEKSLIKEDLYLGNLLRYKSKTLLIGRQDPSFRDNKSDWGLGTSENYPYTQLMEIEMFDNTLRR